METNSHIATLCGTEKCTACSACYSICPKGAIKMVENERGELHPTIDANLCIGCGLCEKACPENGMSATARNGKPQIFACWLKDSATRKSSTSGGAAFAISSAIIAKGGHVWGAAYGDNLSINYTEANTLDELKRLQRSKYAQCHVGEAFKTIKAELDNGDTVLFAGTGCHVKGLRSFLKKEYPNLYTLDLVCHGVPGQGVFRKYKESVEKKVGDAMTDFVPRPKGPNGHEINYCSVATFKNKGEHKLERIGNSYFVGFQNNLFLRSACHNCQANGEERYSDFTVADFWGLGKVKPFNKHKERTLGISMLALNTEKAKEIFELFKDQMEYEERSYKEASFTNTQYYKSAKTSPARDMFWKDYPNMSWDELADKYMRMSAKELILYGIKKFTPPNLLLYAKLLAKWIK